MVFVGDEYGIYYQPDVAAGRVSSNANALAWRIGSLVVSLVVIGVAWAIWPTYLQTWAPWALGITGVVSGFLVIVSLIRYLRSRSEAAKAAAGGLVIGLNRAGMLIDQRWLTWPEVGSMIAKPGLLGASHQLVATFGSESVRIPLGVTDTLPASLDSAVQVLSNGQLRVDLSRFE
jgi:hypothetical protein